MLGQKLGVPHISTGDLFRYNVGQETALGKEAKGYLDAGELVPDSVTNAMVKERLAQEDAKDGFLLDGFPRNTAQADVLGQILKERDEALDAVLEFQVPEDVLVERLLARGRSDDNEDVIRRRQQVYRSETAPLLGYYADILLTVDAVGAVEEITGRALDALNNRK
ncbi:adenylate kinase [Crossiella equi]|uniref:Adenylate kinase n=1 Tax=Crossiella equi TaxID=130796 RepID=A0ABS5AHW1_9PSEU|nr:adenylate kinase [Crossiella equi]